MGIWAAKLTRLDLSRNHLSHFPLLVRDMLQLKVLDLSFNARLQMSLPGCHLALYEPDRYAPCLDTMIDGYQVCLARALHNMCAWTAWQRLIDTHQIKACIHMAD